LLDGGGAEGELRHGPDNIGHDGGDEPGPAQERVEVAVDEVKGPRIGRKSDVGDGREHDDAANHCQWLHPQKPVTGNDAEKERSCQGAAAESDGSLHPARAGEFRVGREFLEGWGVFDGFDGGEFALVLVRHGFW
jgi:hypothetical protein